MNTKKYSPERQARRIAKRITRHPAYKKTQQRGAKATLELHAAKRELTRVYQSEQELQAKVETLTAELKQVKADLSGAKKENEEVTVACDTFKEELERMQALNAAVDEVLSETNG